MNYFNVKLALTPGADLPQPEADILWKQYADAMKRRRPDSVLSYESMMYYLEYTHVFRYNDSFIVGQLSNGVFKPSHFAPATIREGMEAIAALRTYDNVLFAVTDDLAPMLQRMGYFTSDNAIVPMYFRDALVMKHLYSSSVELANTIASAIEAIIEGEESIDNLLNHKFELSTDDHKSPELFDDEIEEHYYVPGLKSLL